MTMKMKYELIVLIAAAFVLFSLTGRPLPAADFSTWNAMSSGVKKDIKAIWGSDSSDVFAAGNGGLILHYNGLDWKTMKSGTTADLAGMWGTDGEDVYAVGAAGTVIQYDGSVWNSIGSDNSTNYYGIWGDRNDVYIAGEAGAVKYYNGKTWTTMVSNTTLDLYSLWGEDSEIFAVGRSGAIISFDGDTWSVMKSGTTQNLRSVWGTDSRNVFAVGDSNTIIRYNGSTWRSISSEITGDLYGVWGTGKEAVFVVGESGSVAAYDGAEFIAMNRDSINDLRTIWGVSEINMFAAGRSGTILRYLPPVIDSISQIQGDQGENLELTISGRNLLKVSEVRLGTGIAVNRINAESAELITVNITIVAGAEPGSRDLTVTASGGSSTLPGCFTVNEAWPVIASVSPDQERQGSTISLTITGSHLKGTSAVHLGDGIAVNKFTVLSANQLSVEITIAADARSGKRDVAVTTAGGSFTLPGGFTVNQAKPAVNSINPVQGNQETRLTVTINGADLNGASEVGCGAGITVNSFQVVSSNQIIADISITSGAEIGPRDILVTTPGGSVTFPNSFSVIQALPVITSISPDFGNKGATLTVTIAGSYFSGAREVRLGSGIAVNSYSVLNANQITASITVVAGTENGPRDISITTPGGSAELKNSFIVKQGLPIVSSVSPDIVAQGAVLDVTISGSNLDGTTSVSFGSGASVLGFSNPSATQLRVSLSVDAEAVTGFRDISVTTPGGVSTLSNRFTVKQKSLSVGVIVLIWVGIAVVVGVFGFVLNLLRTKRSSKINSG